MSESVTPDRISEYDRYRETFPREANERRLDLIGRKFRGFSPGEMSRRLDLDPAWRAEFERRIAANLTTDEQAELARLEVLLDEWAAAAPWLLDFAELARQARERLRRSFRSEGMSYPYANDGGLAMSSKKYQKPERVNVEAEILAGVREVEALRGTGPGPPVSEGAPAGPGKADAGRGEGKSGS